VERAKKDDRAARIVHDYMHRPPEELYDLTHDPYERNNLAGDARYAELLQTLRQQLADWRAKQDDPMRD
jgi:hypothetical protein